MVDATETLAVPDAESTALLSRTIMSLSSSVNPLPISSTNNGKALFTYIVVSFFSTDLIILVVGVFLDFRSGLPFEYRTPLIILSLVCLVQLRGLAFFGSILIPRLS